jgi:hypothetical protein
MDEMFKQTCVFTPARMFKEEFGISIWTLDVIVRTKRGKIIKISMLEAITNARGVKHLSDFSQENIHQNIQKGLSRFSSDGNLSENDTLERRTGKVVTGIRIFSPRWIDET